MSMNDERKLRPARARHTVAIWLTIALLMLAVAAMSVANLFIVVVCQLNSYPQCDYRELGAWLLFAVAGLLVYSLSFVAEHDPEFSHDADGGWQEKLQFPAKVMKSAARALEHPATPHRKKTIGSIIVFVAIVVIFLFSVFLANNSVGGF